MSVAPTASADEFERERPHLLSVAYRMLGSRAEAEDAVQEAWLRHHKGRGGGEIQDVRGWRVAVPFDEIATVRGRYVDGRPPLSVISVAVADGRITAIYNQLNPAKLGSVEDV